MRVPRQHEQREVTGGNSRRLSKNPITFGFQGLWTASLRRCRRHRLEAWPFKRLRASSELVEGGAVCRDMISGSLSGKMASPFDRLRTRNRPLSR
jgi:hypothetical protein